MTFKTYLQDEFITHQLDADSKAYTFLNALVVPRPIAFITTKSADGIVNAAPFSYFNAVCAKPTIVSVSIARRAGQHKDTARNIFSTKEFVINICSVDLVHAVNQSAQELPADVSEIDVTGLNLLPSVKISTPRVANTPVQMECRLKQTVDVAEGVELILGEVIHVHVHKSILNEKGHVDFKKFNPLARLSGNSYGQITHFFEVAN